MGVSFLRSIAVTGFVAAALLGAVAASAHPKLMASTPAAAGVADGKGDITLKFNERLVAQFSGMSIMMTDMPGMKMTGPMAVGAITTTLGPDGKTLVGHPKAPLAAGTYKLAWHAVSTDTHRVQGSYSFKVQ